MNTTAKETVCEECEKYKEIRIGSVHYVDALNCRMKPSDRAFSEKIPANEWREVVDRLEVLADPIAETLPEYERINEFVSLVGKLRPALDQHSARIVERLESLKMTERIGERTGRGAKSVSAVITNQVIDRVKDIIKDNK